jgi:GTP cyclohydrolase I
MDNEKITQAVRMILEAMGEDPGREGLRDTPSRVARMYEEICKGIHEDPGQYLEVMFTESHDEMVMLKDIPLYSLCEHHLLPFYGRAHVAYIPRKGKITGLSKLARVVEGFARRLQVQERLTSQIADTINERLQPWGVMLKPGTLTITSAVRGIFETNPASRAEALALIRGN